MNRPTKLRAIYQELRTALGDQVPAGEILYSATKLVELATEENLGVLTSLREPRPTREELPVDEAISDGGWRLLSQEGSIINATFGGEEIDACKRAKLHEYGVGIGA
jgi:hypothetical protein